MESKKKQHWENVFTQKQETEFSWFQQYPEKSVELIKASQIPLSAKIIDIGGGDSHLVDVLLDLGYQNIWVLDISEKALERVKARLGHKGENVKWIVSDITDYKPDVEFDLWHDRAAFHFLTSDEQVKKYIDIASMAIAKNGYLILGTFSENGPEKCSGLPVRQYSEIAMESLLDGNFSKIKCTDDDHKTPFGTDQNFVFCVFKNY